MGSPASGGVYHTVNPRLFEEQIVYILNHAGDRVLCLDLTFIPLIEKLQERLPHIERFIVLTDAAHMPPTRLRNAAPYEEWLAEVDDDFAWAALDENTAVGLCYTSGTTGEPKGVLYSHRSNVIHSLISISADCFGLAACDIAMPVVPLFHANGWSFAFSAPMAGASLVLPGPKLDGPSIHELLEQEGVTITAAVPTVWLALLHHLEIDGRQAHDAEARRHRRFRLPARDHASLRDEIRRHGQPCLGHDGDEPARLLLFDQAGRGGLAG